MGEDSADADEEVEVVEEEWGDRDEDGGAEVPFVARRLGVYVLRVCRRNCCC